MDTYTQQDEYDKLKEWWKNYGVSLVVGVAIGVAALFGYKYWTQYQERQAQAASQLYEEFQGAVRVKQRDAAKGHSDRLRNEFASTPYAPLSALVMARLLVESGDIAAARERLEWVVDQGRHDAVVHAARLRLGRLRLDLGDKDGAAKLASLGQKSGFEAEYAELRGDVLATQGQTDAAREAYREAMKSGPAGAPASPAIRIKLEALGSERAK